jgi:hypothetical protein
MSLITLHRGATVTVKVAGQRVSASYVGPSRKVKGAAEVIYASQTYHRTLLTGPAIQPMTTGIVSEAIADGEISGSGLDLTAQPTVITARVRTFDINTRFSFMQKMVDMVLAGPSMSLIISGDGGLGKSFMVRERLGHYAFKAEEDFKLLKGHVTSRMVYRTLWEHRNKVIIFDDCDEAFKDPIACNVLKAALETDPNEPRVVCWSSSVNTTDGVPVNFVFEGRVILITNMQMMKVPQALVSRSLHIDVSMDANEKIARLKHLAPVIRPDLELPLKIEVLELMDRLRHQTPDLNVRTFLKVCDIRMANPDVWLDMGEYALTTSQPASN